MLISVSLPLPDLFSVQLASASIPAATDTPKLLLLTAAHITSVCLSASYDTGHPHKSVGDRGIWDGMIGYHHAKKILLHTFRRPILFRRLYATGMLLYYLISISNVYIHLIVLRKC